MKVATAFAIAAWIGLVAASALAIYGLGSFERVYGKWGTFHMILWLAIPFGAVCGIVALGGLMAGSRGPVLAVPNRRLLVASSMFGSVIGAVMLASELVQLAWLAWVLSIVSAFVGGRMLARRSV